MKQHSLQQLRIGRISGLFSVLFSIALLLGIPHPATAQIAQNDTGEFRRIEQPLGLKLGITAAGLGLIGLELWWFLLSKTKPQTAQVIQGTEGIQAINITVDGGYSPNHIVVQRDQPVQLNFLRKDPSSCLEQVILPDFNKAIDLPLNQTVTVEILPQTAGTYTFHCGMNMFRGTLSVEDNTATQ
jgi:plastocyanin domain-containing protein